MDIKLLGSTGLAAIAVFAIVGQYGAGSEASSFASAIEPAIESTIEPIINSITEPVTESIIEPEIETAIEPVNQIAVEKVLEQPIVNLLTKYAVPSITGFLNPDGFSRPTWQAMNGAKLIEDPHAGIERFVVMIDPGHGGTDPGSKAHNGLLEKELTLDIARRVRLFLSEFNDIEVVLTRNHDHGLSRQARVNAIKRSEADMVVSLHLNHLPQTDITLVESFYAGPENIARSQASRRLANGSAITGQAFTKTSSGDATDLGFTKGSARLAQTLQQRVYSEVSFEKPQADNAGVKQKTLFVLTRSFTPGVLIELTCLSNVDEAEKLEGDDYRNRLAAALADGIRHYQESLDRSPLDTLTDIGA